MNKYEAYQKVLQELTKEQLVNVAAANLMTLDKCSDVLEDEDFQKIVEECKKIIPDEVAVECWNISDDAEELLLIRK